MILDRADPGCERRNAWGDGRLAIILGRIDRRRTFSRRHSLAAQIFELRNVGAWGWGMREIDYKSNIWGIVTAFHND